jgi:prepilin-type N-terminal cleavage/methylation domain-containing protein
VNVTGRFAQGFTLIELMVTLVIAAILLALAVPTFRVFVEKRQVESAAQELQNFIAIAQSQAVKRNQNVALSWWAERENHPFDFCLGISSFPKTVPCDCQETLATDPDFCAVGASASDAADGTPYRLSRTDFIEDEHNFAHFVPRTGSYQFEPVRGMMIVDPPNGRSGFGEAAMPGYNFRFHSHLTRAGSDGDTLFAVCLVTNRSGRTRIFNDTDEPQNVGPWPEHVGCD